MLDDGTGRHPPATRQDQDGRDAMGTYLHHTLKYLTRQTGGPVPHHPRHSTWHHSTWRDATIIDGEVNYWAPDGTPCSFTQWTHHFDDREILTDHQGPYRVTTIYHGLNAGLPTPADHLTHHDPIVWITIDAWNHLHYSTTRTEALLLHELALADARHR